MTNNKRRNRDEKKGIIFSAPSGKFIQCPVAGCGHIGKIITKAHCKMHHNMSTWDVYVQFGQAEVVEMMKGYRPFSSNNDHLRNSVEKLEEDDE